MVKKLPSTPILEVRNLSINYVTEDKIVMNAVENVSFVLRESEMLGIVGESGCGKTTMMLALLRLLPFAGRIVNGEILYRGKDLLSLTENEMSNFRWNEIAIIFQGAMNALDPVMTIGNQIAEAIKCHTPTISKIALTKRVGELLETVGIPASRQSEYPFQFSGGMRQRAMIAMALACNPSVLIADEPTTALDVMIQAQILELLEQLSKTLGLSVILITHDLGVVAEICDHVLVMYGGVTAEYADVDTIYNHSMHPYTQNLIKAFPNLANPLEKLISIPGYPPRLDHLPPGCRFQPRCPQAFERCAIEHPPLYRLEGQHGASCFLLEEQQK
jgi:oligopeptide/dipeptide ABC transporter ATP-binding protein